MIYRILASLVLLFLGLFFPVWFFLLATFVFAIVFPLFFEGLILIILVYAIYPNSFVFMNFMPIIFAGWLVFALWLRDMIRA